MCLSNEERVKPTLLCGRITGHREREFDHFSWTVSSLFTKIEATEECYGERKTGSSKVVRKKRKVVLAQIHNMSMMRGHVSAMVMCSAGAGARGDSPACSCPSAGRCSSSCRRWCASRPSGTALGTPRCSGCC